MSTGNEISKLALVTLAVVTLSKEVTGQRKTYLGFEFGPKYEIMQVPAHDDQLYSTPYNNSVTGGLSFGWDFGKRWTLETGLYGYKYHHGIGVKGTAYASAPSFSVIQVPLRAKQRFYFLSDRLQIAPSAGVALIVSTIPNYVNTAGYHGFETDDGSTGLRYNATNGRGRNTLLLEVGILLGWQFKNQLIVYLTGNYLKGDNQVINLEVEYWVDNQPSRSTNVSSTGDYLNSMIGIKFPLNSSR
ncbi:MAG: hypothetical protein RIB86_22000 [Imperialibacter sp.]